MSRARLAVLYEHPEWFKPLFTELERQRIDYVPLYAGELSFDPAVRTYSFDVVLNRMSPSSYLRGHAQAIFFCREFLRYLANVGVDVINGYDAYSVETSKAAQIEIFERTGMPYPRTCLINHSGQALEASHGLRFPIVIKPNIGGSGAKIQHFATRDDLVGAVNADTIDVGIDHTGLVQEFLPARNGAVIRVEVLDGEMLYAIQVFPPPSGGFNLCPADICQDEVGSPSQPDLQFCPGGEPAKRRMHIEAYRPPDTIIQQVLTIASEAQLDVGGIEYLIDDRDGQPYFYDVNALSNFVTDAETVVGMNPMQKFVEFIACRMRQSNRARTV